MIDSFCKLVNCSFCQPIHFPIFKAYRPQIVVERYSLLIPMEYLQLPSAPTTGDIDMDSNAKYYHPYCRRIWESAHCHLAYVIGLEKFQVWWQHETTDRGRRGNWRWRRKRKKKDKMKKKEEEERKDEEGGKICRYNINDKMMGWTGGKKAKYWIQHPPLFLPPLPKKKPLTHTNPLLLLPFPSSLSFLKWKFSDSNMHSLSRQR